MGRKFFRPLSSSIRKQAYGDLVRITDEVVVVVVVFFYKQERALGFRYEGAGIKMESELPHLVCIDDDVLSTGVTLYHLKVSVIFLYKALFYEVSLYQDQSVHDFKSGERKILEGTSENEV